MKSETSMKKKNMVCRQHSSMGEDLSSRWSLVGEVTGRWVGTGKDHKSHLFLPHLCSLLRGRARQVQDGWQLNKTLTAGCALNGRDTRRVWANKNTWRQCVTAAQTERLHCNFALALWPTSGLSGPWPFTSILRQYSVMEINPILAFDNQMNKAIHRASPVYSLLW